ncbi:MFS transporter [Rhodococcus marinonascens]|uniref:MFS transporter n=1 Tax=Rhodococcus marinonascens TaxID=38311 RepID=UPI0009348D2B|nr:MFS transporter [Rhodococcus marinonascens]
MPSFSRAAPKPLRGSAGRSPALAIAATAFAFLATMMGTTLPTPLYSIYAQERSFSALTVTILFAVYALGVVAALTLFGRLSDDVGRRPVLLVAVALAALSAVLFLLSSTLPVFVLARVVSGLSAGLMTGTGTAAMIDLFPAERKAIGGMLAVAVNTGGLGLGTLSAGVLADVTSSPLTIPYLVNLVLALLAVAGLWIFAPAPATRPKWQIRPRRLQVPPSIRGAFVTAVLAAGAAFSVSGVLTAVSALFLAKFLGLISHTLPGLVVSLAFLFMAVGQFVAGRMSPVSALLIGCIGLTLAAALLAVALASTALAPLLASSVVLGLAGGLCLNAAIATTVEQVEPELRGGVSSALFAGIYVMLAVPAIGVGILTEFTDLRTAGVVFSGLVALLSVAMVIAQLVGRRSA